MCCAKKPRVLASALPAIAAVLLYGQVLSAQSIPESWDDVDYHLLIGDTEVALELLAELSLIESETGAALEAAAAIYIDAADLGQAVVILEELVALPGYGDVAPALAGLYWRLGKKEKVVDLYESRHDAEWSDAMLSLVRQAYIAVRGSAPKLVSMRRSRLRYYWTSTGSSSEYPPFDRDSVRDTEYVAGSRLRLRLPLGGLRIEPEIIWQHYFSESSPASFPRYAFDRFSLSLGGHYETGNWRIKAKAGNYTTDNENIDIATDFQHLWNYAADVEYESDAWLIVLDMLREPFLDTDADKVAFERFSRYRARLELYPSPDIIWRSSLSQREFSGSVTDYRTIDSGIMYRLPAGVPLSAGVDIIHEFRDEDETIVTGTVDLPVVVSAGNLYFSVALEANTHNGDRELDTFLSWSRTFSDRQVNAGMSVSRELANADSQSIYVFLTISGTR